jgi:hypothetical protein
VSGPKNVEIGPWKAIAQQLDRGQGENEIANRAAADDEDAVQINSG